MYDCEMLRQMYQGDVPTTVTPRRVVGDEVRSRLPAACHSRRPLPVPLVGVILGLLLASPTSLVGQHDHGEEGPAMNVAPEMPLLTAVLGPFSRPITVLERAVGVQDRLVYDEPEPLNFAARHWLGAVLLEAGRAAEAERVYQASLFQHFNNGWSYFGLEQALRSQGKTAEADAAAARFRESWARSDTLLRTSRF